MRIEPARTSDFLAIAALDRIAWLHTGEPYIADGEHVWRVWCEYATVMIARHNLPVADETGDIAAALLEFPTNDGRLFLHKIMVHPEQRGQGIGTKLMEQALASATIPVLLTVNPTNEAAIKLYRRYGFDIERQVQGYYRAHEHRLVMMRPAPGASGSA
jgi:[ribosomal protein S18]-alanine N-acetyltransferase